MERVACGLGHKLLHVRRRGDSGRALMSIGSLPIVLGLTPNRHGARTPTENASAAIRGRCSVAHNSPVQTNRLHARLHVVNAYDGRPGLGGKYGAGQ